MKRIMRILSRIYYLLPNHFNKSIHLKTKFIFIVGCGHSGTTIISTLIGRSNEVFLYPEESDIFTKPIVKIIETLKSWDIFTRYLKKSYCVEKTPKHVMELKKIFKILPNSKVIFVTRNPIDNVASLTNRNGNLHKSLKRWIKHNEAGYKYLNDTRVLLLKYELIFEKPNVFIEKIYKHTGIKLNNDIFKQTSTQWLNEHSTVGSTKLLEKRIAQITQPIYDTRGSGKKILKEDEIILINKATHKLKKKLNY